MSKNRWRIITVVVSVVVVGGGFLLLGKLNVGQKSALGPSIASSTDSFMWYTMSPQDDSLFGDPMLYDVYYNGISVGSGNQESGKRWIELELYSEGGISRAWTSLDATIDTSLSIDTEMLGTVIVAEIMYDDYGGNRLFLNLPTTDEESFTVYAENSDGKLFTVIIEVDDIVD